MQMPVGLINIALASDRQRTTLDVLNAQQERGSFLARA